MSKLLIVDDHPLFREGVVSVLTHLMQGAQVFAVPSVRDGLALLAQHTDVDLVLIDLDLPELDGFEALRLFARAHPSVARVVISGQHVDAPTLARIMGLGASGFIPKTLAVSAMLGAIQTVLDGDVYLPDPRAAPPAVPPLQRPGAAPVASTDIEGAARVMSVRQLEVLSLVGQGRSNKEIARALAIAERTVKAHATQIFEALGVSNRTQAVLVAQRIGLLPG